MSAANVIRFIFSFVFGAGLAILLLIAALIVVHATELQRPKAIPTTGWHSWRDVTRRASERGRYRGIA
mgnify:CR=1 FL=1